MPRFISRGSATPVDDFKESLMRFVDPTEPYRKSGGWGTSVTQPASVVTVRTRKSWPHPFGMRPL
jgi:hypothetical protein